MTRSFDVAVIGAGPAGLQAAIHSARRRASTIVIGRPSSSAMHGIKLENLVGLPGASSGTEFLENGIEQAKAFGAEFAEMNILSAVSSEGGFGITAENGEKLIASAVVVATGVSRNRLGILGEREFSEGRGVSYCASCDCNFYRGRTVAVVGGQSEAAVSADLMTKYAARTYWIAESFDADASLVTKAEAAGAERIPAKIAEIRGGESVTSILLEGGREIKVDGVFVELGGRSSVDILMDLGVMPEIDDTVKVDRSYATAVPGVFACGDITGKPWQVAKAIGEGAVAGMSAAEYAGRMRRRPSTI